jgi:hypothetical protein
LQDLSYLPVVEPHRRSSCGSKGHPSTCMRSCTFEQRSVGRCRLSAFCSFCHGSHGRSSIRYEVRRSKRAIEDATKLER